jgi:hypothetical protein
MGVRSISSWRAHGSDLRRHLGIRRDRVGEHRIS